MSRIKDRVIREERVRWSAEEFNKIKETWKQEDKMSDAVRENLKHFESSVDRPLDGSDAHYYDIPKEAEQLQDLISYLNLNAQLGEILRAVYRYGRCPHSPKMRDAKKIRFYIDAEIKRLKKYET